MLRVAPLTCAVCAVATWLSMPCEVAAKSGGAGFGAHRFFSARPTLARRPFNHGAFRNSAWIGGGIASTYPYFEPAYGDRRLRIARMQARLIALQRAALQTGLENIDRGSAVLPTRRSEMFFG